MSLILNFTASQAAHLVHLGSDGDWRATAVAKLAFVWDETAGIQAVPARPIRLVDEWAGAPYDSGLLRAAELGPLKANLDLLVAGAIAFQRPTAEAEAEVGLSVGARLRKRARIFSDGVWPLSAEQVGFGPIATHCPQRLALVGTCDEVWENTRRPLSPVDFSHAFFNVAPADQQLDGYIDGEECRLFNMTPVGTDRFFLPSLKIPIAFVTSAELIEDLLTVDTVTIEPEDRRISILAKAEAHLADGPESLGRIMIGAMGSAIRVAVQEGRELPGEPGQ